ncbi:phytanoyl-CoA dioxygenase family protein [Paenibacillus rhizovicinus]|uniref:Phytanoyl-CoA dioxygenase family protein n=1 Tax=Paenibacillus rhizovicinus TaxID=2704463 RepID=A0A6C0NYU3_9BACL|nr:phytanoyl-CoA dioxygenase family protein [Paenibacillus rhizovicinus]QHW31369.1 phytanoyl-CoA dioxygenase family protein [Paenibacillus rhizovicinus]
MANGIEQGLTEQEISRYWEDGFLVFDDILTAEEVEELRLACEQPQITALRSQKDYETKTVHSLGITALHPAFLKLAKHPAIVAKLIPLLGADIELQHSKLATKPPTKGVGIFAWHQDYAFYPHTNTDLLSVMVMLDDATPENGCMRMVKGSHRLGQLNHLSDGRFAAECQESRYWERPANPNDIVLITPKTGGISIHHTLTLHGSDANASGKPRRGIVFSYRASDAYQLADTLFDDTGLTICGSNKGIVRCAAGVVTLPYRGGNTPYGSAWNQVGGFAWEKNGENA